MKPASLAAVVLAYCATRLYGLMNLPIFVDEALHLSRSIDNNVHSVFIRGKVLSVIALSPLMGLPADPLWLARVLVVALGLITLLAIIWIGAKLFSFRVGLLSGLIYVLLPYALFYNRIDVADDYEWALAALALVYSIRIAYEPGHKLDAILLGVALTGSILAKITSFIFFLIPPMTVVALTFPRDLRRPMRAIFSPMFVAGVITIALVMLDYGGQELRSKGGSSLHDVVWNLFVTANWYWVLLTPVGCLLLVLGAFRRDRRLLLLASIFAMIPAAYIVGANTLYSRYVLVSLVPACVIMGNLAARWLDGRRRRDAIRAGIMVGLLLASLVPIDWTMITRPQDSVLPGFDRTQYITSYPSGYGMAEMTAYLETTFDPISGEKQVVVLGNNPNPNATIAYLLRHRTDVKLTRAAFDQLDALAEKPGIWLIMDRTYRNYRPTNKTLIWSYIRPGATVGLEIWR